MIESQSPMSWNAPDWHPDFGNAKAECEHLRKLALAVLSKVPYSTVELIIPESGLMLLQIVPPNGTTAEAYSLCGTKGTENRRYGLFLSPGIPREQEFYATSVSQAIRILQESVPSDPDSPIPALKRKKTGAKDRGAGKRTRAGKKAET
jgi:hypothetical protein